ncbi:hypothetical protein [Paenibacillus zanthoxyli]|uniref:hypothetical protein n=1 Tax=Paenibacillus zanthoxyli TaxID=369399 RepID=UPI0004723BB8|nr:hypothetical protein [Paenibacillus zanthoxyli]
MKMYRIKIISLVVSVSMISACSQKSINEDSINPSVQGVTTTQSILGPEATLIGFLDSVEKHDYTKAASYAKSDVYKNQKELAEFYSRNIPAEPLIDYQILKQTVDGKDNKQFLVSMDIKTNGTKQSKQQNFVLKEIKGEWKVYFEAVMTSEDAADASVTQDKKQK